MFSIRMLENTIELLEEDIPCVHMYLDTKNIPRFLGENEYSMVERIELYK